MTAPLVICPHCRVGEVKGGAVRCPMCGRPVSHGNEPPDPIPAAIDADVRRELDRLFTVDRVLGRGGMSVVYLAREVELGRPVALKILPLQLTMGADAIERFKREARIAASLDYPHIVPVHRVGSTPRFMWYSMKWVKGRSLQRILHERGRLELDETLRILEPVASALHHAHRRGIVHRDVKPGNILVDESGWVMVCDFGLAKAFGSLQLTATGMGVGTPGYMSPEQCYGKDLNGRSDEYALAILTYECLTGALPFTADSFGEIVRKHCLEPPPSIASLRPDLPEHVAPALLRAMSKDPDERYPDVLAFVEALGGSPGRPAEVSSDPSLAELAVETPAPPAKRTRWVAAVAVLSVLLVVAVLGLVRVNRPLSPTPGSGPAVLSADGEHAYLVADARPAGATVLIDGRPIGNTPIQSDTVAPGTHTVTIIADGFKPYERTMDFLAGRTDTLIKINLHREQ